MVGWATRLGRGEACGRPLSGDRDHPAEFFRRHRRWATIEGCQFVEVECGDGLPGKCLTVGPDKDVPQAIPAGMADTIGHPYEWVVFERAAGQMHATVIDAVM